MLHTLIASALLLSAPARNPTEAALWVELDTLTKELDTAAAAEYVGIGRLQQQCREQIYNDDVALAVKLALRGKLVRIADAAAPKGAQVARRFEQVFARVSPELGWGPMRDEFRRRYFEGYVETRARMRFLRYTAIIGHRWPAERREATGFNYTVHVTASVLLLREEPGHRDALLWRLAWAEVFLTDLFGAPAKAPPARLARAR